MNGEMVRATLSGNKTQTRRIIKDQPYTIEGNVSVIGGIDTSIDILRDKNQVSSFIIKNCKCPYGKVGDQLWIRETWFDNLFPRSDLEKSTREEIHYRADGIPDFEGEERDMIWKQSNHMPRWASRIQLEITDIRVERLLDMNEGDAMAEGVCSEDFHSPFDMMRKTWESIYGPDSWSLNPWVWVVEFKRVEKS